MIGKASAVSSGQGALRSLGVQSLYMSGISAILVFYLPLSSNIPLMGKGYTHEHTPRVGSGHRSARSEMLLSRQHCNRWRAGPAELWEWIRFEGIQ